MGNLMQVVLYMKHRRKVIDDTISGKLKSIFEGIRGKYHISIKEWNHDIDHIHVLMTTKPNTELSKFVKKLNGGETHQLWNRIVKEIVRKLGLRKFE